MQNPKKGAPPRATVLRQPKAQQPRTAGCQKSRWSSKVLDCCQDKHICVCGLCCLPCMACQVAKTYGECFCQPLLPGGLVMLRANMRQRYHIEGSVLDDVVVVQACGPCALCQMAREYKSQEV